MPVDRRSDWNKKDCYAIVNNLKLELGHTSNFFNKE